MNIIRKLAKLMLILLTLPLLFVVWLLKWFVLFLHCCSAWIFYLRISRPGVRVPSIAPENAVKSKDFMAFLFCKPWLHGFCTVFARSVLSMSDDVGRCIALQSVPFLHQVSSARRSFAFISGSASLSNSSRAVMEMVGSPAAGTACGLGASGLA